MSDAKVNPSGLTDDDAKEFHEIFTKSAIVFIGIAVVAHVLAWAWRPWLHAAASAMNEVTTIASSLV